MTSGALTGWQVRVVQYHPWRSIYQVCLTGANDCGSDYLGWQELGSPFHVDYVLGKLRSRPLEQSEILRHRLPLTIRRGIVRRTDRPRQRQRFRSGHRLRNSRAEQAFPDPLLQQHGDRRTRPPPAWATNWRTNYDRYLHIINPSAYGVVAERPDGSADQFHIEFRHLHARQRR